MPADEISQDVMNTFVIAAHGDLPKVQALLAEHPALLHSRAAWQRAIATRDADVADLRRRHGAREDAG